MATKVVARLNAALGVTLTVRDLFEAPTAHRLAGHVGASRETDGATDAPVPILPLARPDRPAATAALAGAAADVVRQPARHGFAGVQHRVRGDLTGQLDVAALRAAIGDVVERHEALRTVFPVDAEGPQQVIVPAESAVPDVTPAAAERHEAWEQIRRVSVVGFDVREEPPLRAQLFRLGPEEHVLAVVVHHIAADGQSVSPLARDVMVAYAARRAGGPPRGPRCRFSTPITRCGNATCSATSATAGRSPPASCSTGRPGWRTFRLPSRCRTIAHAPRR
ncbi:hypothetical protein GS937_04095 [Rhodococcus hoagii]|nr:hypothetical protein [Prescottella equi]